MNDERIEQLLRKAPRSPAPAGLLEKLQSDITLPGRLETKSVTPTEGVPLIRRWFPALSFAAIFLACIVAIAVQTNQIAGLKHERATLQTAAQNLEQLRRDNAEYQRLKDAHEELERLRRDFGELQQLRTEVTQLRARAQEMDKLKAENQLLSAANRQPGHSSADDFFSRNEDALAKARANAEAVACINNLKQIGLAARIWATDNSDVLPPNWLAMSNELATPKILVCPGDKGRTPARSWAEFTAANVSYEFLNPSGTEAAPYVVLTRCPIHLNVGLTDGSAWMGSGLGSNFAISVQDGKQVFIRLDPPTNTDMRELMRRRYGLSTSTNVVPSATNPPKPSYE